MPDIQFERAPGGAFSSGGCSELTGLRREQSVGAVQASAPWSDSLNDEQHWPAGHVPLPTPQLNISGRWQYELGPEYNSWQELSQL
jgi:hypothetical protein